MTHKDHVQLIEKGIPKKGGSWADFGSGEGAFTLALRDVVGESGKFYSIDKDSYSLAVQKAEMEAMFPKTTIEYIEADFLEPLKLPQLDGIVAANSIHFQRNTFEVFQVVKSYLKPNGTLIVVEYNTDTGNTWVPYPFSFETFVSLAEKAGLSQPMLLTTIPSGFLQEIYSAAALNA